MPLQARRRDAPEPARLRRPVTTAERHWQVPSLYTSKRTCAAGGLLASWISLVLVTLIYVTPQCTLMNERPLLLSLTFMKIRLDKLLVDQGHAASRERAQALILAGRVLVNEQRIDKPGASVPSDATIRMLGSDLKYVSRGGLKLEHALAHWKISLTNVNAVDIGASTGGFTDCMLQAGAATVLAVDTGYGQIAHKLRDDPRVD